MNKAVSNTSPLLYLYRIDKLEWLPQLFESIWIPNAVVNEMKEGRSKGYNTPDPEDYVWMEIIDPKSVVFEWLSSDLGAGELSAMTLALENADRIVLLDDALARNTAKAAGLNVWGTLRILLEAKAHGLTGEIKPHVEKLAAKGMWLSDGIRRRILKLADEK